MELTLLRLDIQSVLKTLLQDLSDVSRLLRQGPREDQDIVNVDEDRAVQHVPEDIINQGLEDSGGVGEPEGHN